MWLESHSCQRSWKDTPIQLKTSLHFFFLFYSFEFSFLTRVKLLQLLEEYSVKRPLLSPTGSSSLLIFSWVTSASDLLIYIFRPTVGIHKVLSVRRRLQQPNRVTHM